MAMYAKVRRMRMRDGLSISEIARRTSLSRNTIKTWLRGPARTAMTYQRSTTVRKIGPYASWLREALEADARRPRRERRTAVKLFAQLRAEGFGGSYQRVRCFHTGFLYAVSLNIKGFDVCAITSCNLGGIGSYATTRDQHIGILQFCPTGNHL